MFWFRVRFDSSFSYLLRLTISGSKIPADTLTEMIYPRRDGRKAFKYPQGRQLRINGIVPKKLLAHPDLLGDNDHPRLIVLKDGNSTD